MLVMGLDTALQRCSVAILENDGVLARKAVGMERGHAEALAPMAAEVLAEAGCSVPDLDRIGVVVGPGGFTGLRVALSFARGLAVGTGAPVAGVTSLAALAENIVDAPEGGLMAPVIDARRGQVYAGLYERGGAILLEPFIATPEQALKQLTHGAGGRAVRLIGTGASLLQGAPASWDVSEGDPQIDVVAVARLAAHAPAPACPPAPLYLRPPDAKPPQGVTARGGR